MRTFGFLVVLCFFGCKDRPDALGDRPLGTRIHFSTLHYPDGAKQPRRFGITGTLDGSGELSLDPNTLILDSDGKVTGSTLLGFNLGFNAIPVQIRAVDTPDPVKLGRKIYEIVAGNSGAVRKYSCNRSLGFAAVFQAISSSEHTYLRQIRLEYVKLSDKVPEF